MAESSKEIVKKAMQEIARRRPGKSKLIYNKTSGMIESVSPDGQRKEILKINEEEEGWA